SWRSGFQPPAFRHWLAKQPRARRRSHERTADRRVSASLPWPWPWQPPGRACHKEATSRRPPTRPRAAHRPTDGLGLALRSAHPQRRGRRLCRAGPARAGQPGTHHADRQSAGFVARYPGAVVVPARRRAWPGADSPPAVAADCPDAGLAAATPRLAGTPATDRPERPLSGSFLISCGRRQFCKLLQPSLRPFPERVPPRAPPSRRSKTCLAGARFVLRSAPTACSVSSPGSPVARGAAPSTERIPALLPRGDHGAGHDCRLRETRSLSGQRSPGMAKCKSLPPHAVHVRTFAELEQYVGAFAEGHLNLLMIFGQPGVGKSPCVRQALGRNVCWISGQATPFGIYLQAYEHRHQPIVLDDVDGLYADRQGIRLLKALGQTESTKTLSWQSAAPALERHDIPRQFTTTSRVALVGNDWKTLNADVAALEDRGHLLLFEPAPLA